MNNYEYYKNIYDNTERNSDMSFCYGISKVLSDTNLSPNNLKWHEQLEIKYIISGFAEIICGPNVFIARPGDVVLINPSELHGMRAYGNTEPVYHTLIIAPSHPFSQEISKALNSVSEGKIRFNNLIYDNDEIRQILLRFFNELQEKKEVYQLSCTGYINLLLAYLFRNEIAKSNSNTDFDDVHQYGERLRPAIELINQRYREDISLAELAETSKMSVYHFCRIFKAVTGHTTVSYINRFRVNKSALLLRTTNMSVAEIASSVGFEDECYFSRCFKRYKNISPSRYRKEDGVKA